jgi:hypothetical protein
MLFAKEASMCGTMRGALAAVALLCGFSVGAAADTGTTDKCVANEGIASSASLWRMKSELSLPGDQQRTAFDGIRQQATKENVPAGFTAEVGAVVPNAIATYPVPVSVANDVPKLWPYSYALLDRNMLLIVNPNDNKIVEVIRE